MSKTILRLLLWPLAKAVVPWLGQEDALRPCELVNLVLRGEAEKLDVDG